MLVTRAKESKERSARDKTELTPQCRSRAINPVPPCREINALLSVGTVVGKYRFDAHGSHSSHRGTTFGMISPGIS